MKNTFTVLFLGLFCFNGLKAQTACGTCTVSLPTLPADTIYLDPVPNGIVGVPYDEVLSFRLPKTTTPLGPPTPSGITVDQVVIDNVTGLQSIGLDWGVTPGTTFVPATNTDGCVRICGTPTQDGTFPINILVTATVLGGLSQPTSFTLYITVVDTSAIVSPHSGCTPLEVNFRGKPTSTALHPVTYAWDYGNGTGTTANATRTYTTGGTYPISLTSTVKKYVLTDLCINTVTGGYCNDIEEALCNCGTPIIGLCPDPYFTINDNGGAELFSTLSSAGANVSSKCWASVGATILTEPAVLTFWDDDNGSPLGSADDNLGSTPIVLTAGQHTFSLPNVTGSYTLTLATDVVQTFNDTIVVNETTIPQLSQVGEVCVYAGQPINLSVTPANAGNQWRKNGQNFITGSTFQASVNDVGTYNVVFTNAAGCTGSSDTLTLIDCTNTTTVHTPKTSFTISPNPNNGAFNISMEQWAAEDISLRITDMMGRVVYTEQFTATRTAHQVLANLNAGLYTLTLSGNSAQQSVKMVVH